MAEVGYLAVGLAFAAAVFGAVASGVGALTRTGPLVMSGRRGLVASALLSTVAVLVLVAAFIRHDFSLTYVWQTSSRTTPDLYLLTGIWGGQAGSLLFWAWMTAAFGAVAVLRRWRPDRALMPWFTAVMAAVTAFYMGLVVFVANPFERLPVIPPDGNGLNPLLQHPGMAFHPPALYLGLTGLTVPYAFAVAALVSRRLDAGWIFAARRWTLVGWAFLGLGLALGGRWAYDVLGWGGYWGWDPVENAALMPWLAATAYLHSVMVQERRGMFRVWNMVLISLTYSLTVIGTFLTRAGLVSSVHAFAQSDIGPHFFVFTACVVLGGLGLLLFRLPDLRDAAQIESVASRETAFLGNNVLLMGALFAVFWGTLLPLFSEILTGQRVTVGPDYFNPVVGPVFLALVLLMGIGSMAGWRRTNTARVGRALRAPALVTLAVSAGLAVAGVRNPVALAGFAICGLTLILTLAEFRHGLAARMGRGEGPLLALATLFRRQRRRYGGFAVHLGVVVLTMGVLGSNLYQLEAERSLATGDSLAIGDYSLTYLGPTMASEPDKSVLTTEMAVSLNGRHIGLIEPSRQFFRLREDQPRTIPGVLSRPLEDVYVLLGTFSPETQVATFKVYVNPLIALVWLGMAVMVVGTFVAAWPDGMEQAVLNAELSRLMGPQPAAP